MNKITLFLAVCNLILFIIIAPLPPKAPTGVDPKVKMYVDDFYKEGKKHVGDCWNPRKINIGTGDLTALNMFAPKKTTVGVCYTISKDIIIDDYYLQRLSKSELEEVIFHELGHCVLDRGHIREKKNNIPVSLMYPYVLNKGEYVKYREMYMKELFSKESCK